MSDSDCRGRYHSEIRCRVTQVTRHFFCADIGFISARHRSEQHPPCSKRLQLRARVHFVDACPFSSY
ncbi:hypothetical protein RB7248 [Rhodopirellula baltica SH 1]|uniref:Uncharacterized protein n=1 Tax=Rhodopirellula baltica (strain DSM 10527 / NCIMB 13988 / SH1) TaxID=243090 RepID=Q7UNZ7_RHOBA|nr:hypothetical protein RB7248 [Rhodopirellula baltica SH 1]